MNYSDQILENKAFNFFKQLMYNLAVAICIMLVGVLILVYGFKFQLFNVLSDSEYPFFKTGDMVVVKAQADYKVGEILQFNTDKGTPVAHRLVYIHNEGGVDYYVFHGDNVQAANPDAPEHLATWQEDSAYLKDYFETQGRTKADALNGDADDPRNIDMVKKSNIVGKIVTHVDNYGTYFTFIQEHSLLFIVLIAGIWCISSVVQNEIDFKKARRLV